MQMVCIYKQSISRQSALRKLYLIKAAQSIREALCKILADIACNDKYFYKYRGYFTDRCITPPLLLLLHIL